MQAVQMSGITTNVVNGALPDVTNVVLSKLGLAPTCGGGNMDIGLQRIKRIVARDMKVPYQSVQIYGVGHHGTFYTVKYHGPFWVKIIVDGTDVSERYPNDKIAAMYEEAGFASTQQFGGALVDQMKTATSFLNNILGLYFDTKKVHGAVAGPNGLPGAYPARFSADGVEVVLPGISLQDAIDINEKGAQIDGVQEIRDDGTVVFMDENVEYMREVVGYDCKELKPEESEERARELAERLKKVYEKYNVA
jgi:malate/lactate dehydrogenase